MVKIKINGQDFQVPEDTYVLEAAQENGFDIPTFCNDEDLKPFGACRMCLVSITHSDGRKEITSSCDTFVEEGMEIVTDSDEVFDAQRDMADLLLARCPNVPSVQRMAHSFNVRKAHFSSPNKKEDCILCGMCVRACEKEGAGVLGFVGSGEQRHISTFDGKPAKACETCKACVKYCPTGAVTKSLGLEIGKPFHKKAWNWKTARMIVQYSLLILFLFLMYQTLSGHTFPIPINIFSRANLLQALASMVGGKAAIGNFWPALIVLAITLLFGRVWCGWICPTGAVFELYGPKDRKIKEQWMRRVKYVILFTVILMAIFNSMAYLWFEPITVFVRGLTSLVKPGMDYLAAEDKAAFEWPGFGWWSIAIPFVVALLLNLIEKRFWCRYLCPLGALIGLLSKFSLFKRVVDQKACVKCGACTKKCPMGAIAPENNYISDPAECIMCMDCEPRCPMLAISNEKGKMVQWHNEYDPGRREAIGTAVVGVASLGVLTANVGKVHEAKSSVLRPPGALREDETIANTFLRRCIRCDQCILGCPQHILKPSITESGWDGLYTPVVDLSQGHCDNNCNLCGQICPSEAIRKLPLKEKRKAKIGLAYVDIDLCSRCNSCVAICPHQAFEEKQVEGKRGTYPIVLKDKCVGCGMCVHECPVEGGSIHVYPVSEDHNYDGFTLKDVPVEDRMFEDMYFSKTRVEDEE